MKTNLWKTGDMVWWYSRDSNMCICDFGTGIVVGSGLEPGTYQVLRSDSGRVGVFAWQDLEDFE